MNLVCGQRTDGHVEWLFMSNLTPSWEYLFREFISTGERVRERKGINYFSPHPDDGRTE